MAGIPTTYGGILYRSRTEARWAAFFTGIGWRFTYEPFDTAGYLPDFLILGARPLLVEVKSEVTEAELKAHIPKIEIGLKGKSNYDMLIVGADPLPRWESKWGDETPCAGLLGEYPDLEEANQHPRSWAIGHWFRCTECGELNVFHEVMSFGGRPCGHYDGDHYVSPIDPDEIRSVWASASNAVRYERRRPRPV